MKKVIRITMPDGSVWHYPFDAPAMSRAQYYAQKESQPDDSVSYEAILAAELGHADRCPDDIIDWLQNNTYWSEMLEEIEMVHAPAPPDYEEQFNEASFEVIEL